MSKNYGPLVDAFGKLKAEIADLEKKADSYKEELIELGEGSYEGKLFRVTVSPTTKVSTTQKLKDKIAELVEKHLTPQFLAANTKKKPGWQIKASARNNQNVKEAEAA